MGKRPGIGLRGKRRQLPGQIVLRGGLVDAGDEVLAGGGAREVAVQLGGAGAGALAGRLLAGGHDNTAAILGGALIGGIGGLLGTSAYNEHKTQENQSAQLSYTQNQLAQQESVNRELESQNLYDQWGEAQGQAREASAALSQAQSKAQGAERERDKLQQQCDKLQADLATLAPDLVQVEVLPAGNECSMGTPGAGPTTQLGIDALASMLLPALGADFAVPFASLQWVLVAYLLGITCLTVVAGRLGDRFGRRRLLLLGLGLFALASLLCALAPTTGWPSRRTCRVARSNVRPSRTSRAMP